jgi:hypothetical protein
MSAPIYLPQGSGTSWPCNERIQPMREKLSPSPIEAVLSSVRSVPELGLLPWFDTFFPTPIGCLNIPNLSASEIHADGASRNVTISSTSVLALFQNLHQLTVWYHFVKPAAF